MAATATINPLQFLHLELVDKRTGSTIHTVMNSDKLLVHFQDLMILSIWCWKMSEFEIAPEGSKLDQILLMEIMQQYWFLK